MNDKIEFDNLCPMAAAEVVENLSEDSEKGVDFESPLKELKLSRFGLLIFSSFL